MLDAASVNVLTRSLMLGTARHAVPMERVLGGTIAPDDPKATLKVLALVGQHGRFRRSPPIGPVAAEPLFPDERRVIAEDARPLLISLFSGKSGTVNDAVSLAIADAMVRNRVRLHPFDLPRLDEFVKAYCEQLGRDRTYRRGTPEAAVLTDQRQDFQGRLRVVRSDRAAEHAFHRNGVPCGTQHQAPGEDVDRGGIEHRKHPQAETQRPSGVSANLRSSRGQ